MTEEMIKETKQEECKCFCKSEGLRNFIVVAAGTFVGVFCAISLFAALHKPPKFIPMQPRMMQPYAIHNMHGCPVDAMHRHHHFWHGPNHHHDFDAPRHHRDFDGPRHHYKNFDGKKFDKEEMEKIKHKRAIENKIEKKTTNQ